MAGPASLDDYSNATAADSDFSLPATNRRREVINVACSTCRTRKSKCTGERPRCSRCRINGKECIYITQTRSETRSEALQRERALIEARVSSYEKLFNTLQNAPIDIANSMFASMRSGTNTGDLLSQLRASSAVPDLRATSSVCYEYDFPLDGCFPMALHGRNNLYLDSHLYRALYPSTDSSSRTAESSLRMESESPKYRMPYHIARLVDPQLDRVRAQPWTDVTSDDWLVRDLLRTYFTHEYPFNPIFHKDLFLQDMTTNNTDFCSPMLVNAVLALAWHGRPEEPKRSEFWNPLSLGNQFLVEAIRLWKLQRAISTITTIQSTLIIWLITNIDGQDEFSWPWMTHTIAIANDLNLFNTTAACQNPKHRVVRCLTAWSIFTWQAHVCFHFHRPPLLENPPLFPLPNADESGLYFGELCLEYPLAQLPVAMHHAKTFRANAQLRIIMNSMAKDWFGGNVVMVCGIQHGYQKALYYRALLQDWYHNLPVEVSSQQIGLPSVLKTHMHYWALMIYLFEPFKDATPLDIYFNPVNIHEARLTLSRSRSNLEMLLRLYYKRHGFSAWDSALVMFIFVVAAHALREASKTTTDSTARTEALHTLILCAKGLADQSANIYVAEAAFRGLRNSMVHWQVRILATIVEVKDDDKREALMAQHLRSRWPIQVADVCGNPTQEHLGTLLISTEDIAKWQWQ